MHTTVTSTSAESTSNVNKKSNLYYVEKSVGLTQFYKCDVCPYMALAEDDIKYHLFIKHYELAKINGLADNVNITCPGCTDIFETEATLRCHLRTYHKMGYKDIRKMTKSLIIVALSNKKKPNIATEQKVEFNESLTPAVIEIQAVNAAKIESNLAQSVTYITVNELNEMSSPNVAKIDPVELIKEASVNIVCDTTTNSNTNNSLSDTILINSTPDLIATVNVSVSQHNIVNNFVDATSHKRKENSKSELELENSNGDVNSLETTIEEKVSRVCPLQKCKATFISEQIFNYHIKCHSNDHLLCPECKQKFIYIDALHNHLWKKHKIDMELHSCTQCPYKTYFLSRLTRIHMKIHGNIKPYKCNACEKTFKNHKQLASHKSLQHHINKIVTCHLCNREFQRYALKAHIASQHDNIKPFVCGMCGFRVARKAGLEGHMRSHMGEKNLTCNICSYRCSDHNSMRRHKKIHTNENVYKCKYCDYSCIQSHMYKKHIMRMHPEVKDNEIFSCPYCKYKFINKKNYISHLSKHTEINDIQTFINNIKNAEEKKVEIILEDMTDVKIPIELEFIDSKKNLKVDETVKEICATKYNSEQPNTLSGEHENGGYTFADSTLDLMQGSQNIFSECNVIYSNVVTTPNEMHTFSAAPSINTNVYSNPIIHSNHSSDSQRLIDSSSQISIRNFTLSPLDKIPLPSNKIMGSMIKSTQILPMSIGCTSPQSTNNDTLLRKKPKISVKSNMILKGPDEANIFHSQQKMAFKQLEDSENGNYLSSPVSFDNLIMLSDNSNILTFPPQTLLTDPGVETNNATIQEDQNLITFNRQINVASFNNILTQQSLSNNSNYAIKLERNQNIQSPGLDRMGTPPDIMNKYCTASPSLEELNKNMGEIKNEMKSDYFNVLTINNSSTPLIMDPYMLENVMNSNEIYSTCDHELVGTVRAEMGSEVIEIDDNSEDHKMLPRFDENFPLESYYSQGSEFHFLDTDVNMSILNDSNTGEGIRNDGPDLIQINSSLAYAQTSGSLGDYTVIGDKEPTRDVTSRPGVNKINVKNIELMKNIDKNSHQNSDRDYLHMND